MGGANQIVCMRDGKVVENGNPKALLQKQGYYWSLVRRQVCTLDEISDVNLELDQHPAGGVLATQDGEESAGVSDCADLGVASGAGEAVCDAADGVADSAAEVVTDCTADNFVDAEAEHGLELQPAQRLD